MSRGSASPRSSPFSSPSPGRKPAGGRRTPVPLPALPADLRPPCVHPCSRGRTPPPSAAASPRSAGDRSDKPRLAPRAPGPSGPHPPPRPAGRWLALPRSVRRRGLRRRPPTIGSWSRRSDPVPTSARLGPFPSGSCGGGGSFGRRVSRFHRADALLQRWSTYPKPEGLSVRNVASISLTK